MIDWKTKAEELIEQLDEAEVTEDVTSSVLASVQPMPDARYSIIDWKQMCDLLQERIAERRL